MQTVWSILGIEPTADVLAIKRAYAARLKHTRPDDDAGAYQRLRECYEWALRWARNEVEHWVPADTDTLDRSHDEVPIAGSTDTVSPQASVAENASSPSSPTVPALESSEPGDPVTDVAPAPATQWTDEGDDAIEWTDAHTLARDLRAAWQAEGDAALVALWPRLRDELDRQPLSQRDASSTVFAQFVLAHPALPATSLGQLAQYFHWGTDYRAEAALGAERAGAIMQRLRTSGLQRVTNPATLRRYADLLTLQRLLVAGRRLRATLFAALTMPQVGLLLRDSSFADLHTLGLHPATRSAMVSTIKWSMAIWCSLLAIAFMPLVQFRWDYAALPSAVGGVMAALAVSVSAVYAGGLLIALDSFLRTLAPGSQPGHLRHAASVTVALLGAGAAAWSARAIPDPDSNLHSLWLFCWPLALALGWHATGGWRVVLIPVGVAMCIALGSVFPQETPLGVIAGLGLAWTLAAHWLMSRDHDSVQQWYSTPPWTYRPANPIGWVVIAVSIKAVVAIAIVIVMLATPLTYLRQGDRHTPFFAMLGLGVAIATGVILRLDEPLWWLWIVLSPLLLSSALVIARRAARLRWFH
jgi:hypothetical protein